MKMNAKTDNFADDDVEKWFAIMRIGAPSTEDRSAFEAWRAANPDGAAAYDETEALCDDLRRLDSVQELARAVVRKHRSRFIDRWIDSLGSPWRLAGGAAMLSLVLFVAASFYIFAPTFDAEHYATKTAEIRKVVLSDQSEIDLAPASRIRVDYSESTRQVELISGEAYFEVSKVDARPFLVTAGNAQVRVVGTRFNVNLRPAGVTVAVAEGVVDIRQEKPLLARALPLAPAPSLAQRRLLAGEQVTTSADDGLENVNEVTPDDAGAWRSGFLVYTDDTLRDVVADINRYLDDPIVIASDDVADLRLDASFPISRIDDVLSGIEGLLPVTIDRSQHGRIVIRAAEPA